VLQEAKMFHAANVNAPKCRETLTQLIYLINQGQVFTESESTELFFAITKLFQSQDEKLRRIVYLIIKELRNESSIYIITQCITKDMNSKTDLFRMNALRTIPIIIDPHNLVAIERYIKNAVVDRNWSISCSALTAGIHLFAENQELVKKWANEVSDKLNSKIMQTHYHALQLMHEIKK